MIGRVAHEGVRMREHGVRDIPNGQHSQDSVLTQCVLRCQPSPSPEAKDTSARTSHSPGTQQTHNAHTIGPDRVLRRDDVQEEETRHFLSCFLYITPSHSPSCRQSLAHTKYLRHQSFPTLHCALRFCHPSLINNQTFLRKPPQRPCGGTGVPLQAAIGRRL